MNRFFRSTSFLPLIFTPIVYIIIAIFGSYFLKPVPIVDCFIGLPNLFNITLSTHHVLNIFILISVSTLIFWYCEDGKYLDQSTSLGALIYSIMASSIIYKYGTDNLTISLVFLVLAMIFIQKAVLVSKSNSPLFSFSVCIVLAVLFSPKLVMLILWMFLIPIYIGRNTLKDFTALLLGILTVLFFVLFFYFWNNNLENCYDSYKLIFESGELLRDLSIKYISIIVFLLFFLLLALNQIFIKNPSTVLKNKKSFNIIFSLICFLLPSFFFINGFELKYVEIIALPLSLLYTQYLISTQKKWIPTVFFLGLIIVGVFLVPFI